MSRETWRRRPMLVDAILAAVLAVLGVVELALMAGPSEAGNSPAWLAVLLLVPIAGPLVWRRRFPLCAAAVVLVATTVFTSAAFIVAAVCSYIGAYSATAFGRRPWHVPVVSTFFVLPFAMGLWTAYQEGTLTTRAELVGGVVGGAVGWGLPFAIGLVVRRSRTHRRQKVAAAEQDARRAVSQERLRIARELHDVVAHHVSIMGVQAGAARIVLGNRNERASAALAAIEESSRHAVTELHHLLGALRSDGDAEDPTPQPGIDQVALLVERSGRSSLAVEGEPRPVPRTVDVSAYRVVQEALTNSRKHSGGGTAQVRLRYRPDALEIEVVDNGAGTGPKRGPTVGGHGLIGMRERVVQNGGELHAGPRPTGGFGVHAVFPLDRVPA